MHIGVDATCWNNTRGYGRHGRALLSALVRLDAENHYTFFVDTTRLVDSMPPEAQVRLVSSSTPTAVAASANGRRSLGDMWRMSRAMSDRDLDVTLFPTVYSYVPVFSQAKKVVVIHDVIAEKYPEMTLPNRTARLFWKAKVGLGRWQADAIVTVSDYSRRCIIQHFNSPPERVFVVGEASDPVFRTLDNPELTSNMVSMGIAPGRRTIVYVGGFGPHKNLETLVAVFDRFASREEFGDILLVMVGEYKREVFHSYYDTIKRQVEVRGIAERVIFTGYLPDEELVILLNLATVLVLPSLMEGFGLPAIEAAACGCPVIATAASPLPGLLGEGGLYVDPLRREELDAALTRVLRSAALRERMHRAGIAAARELSWEAAARQMLGVLREVAAG